MPVSRKRKGAKKHRPIRVAPGSLLFRVTDPEVTESEIRYLHAVALENLERVRIGSYDPTDYANVQVVLKNLYVLSLVFNECTDLRLLAMMSMLSLSVMFDRQTDLADIKVCKAPIRAITHKQYLYLCSILRTSIDTYFEMVRKCDRETLVRSQQFARNTNMAVKKEVNVSYALIDQDMDEEEIMKKPGAAWVHGEVRVGHLDKLDDGRLIWRMPLTNSFAVVDGPMLALIPNGEKHD